MSKPIAPTLRNRIRLDYSGPYLFAGDREEHEELQREWRLVLAVVRAAQSAIDVEERLAGASILADPSSFTDADVRMARALSRLARGAARKVGP